MVQSPSLLLNIFPFEPSPSAKSIWWDLMSVAAGTDSPGMEKIALLGKGHDIKRKLQHPLGAF